MFRCKQFVVHQDQCAMKVNTDSLILGSWVGQQQAQKLASSMSALDIGTGTGILSLMLAQQSGARVRIDAVELDAQAAQQAADNVRLSPWENKVSVYNSDIHGFTPSARYELIVSNPPYFLHSQQSTNAYSKQTEARQTARQTKKLTANALFTLVESMMTDSGAFFCLYPYDSYSVQLDIAKQLGLRCKALLHIRHNAQKTPYLTAFHFVSQASTLVKATETSELSIRTMTNAYTDEFKSLCRDFYLNF